MKLKNEIYDILKWLVVIVLPAISTFYSTVAPLFGWYDPGTVAQVISAVCVLVGALIGISTAEYNKSNDE